MTKLTAYQLSDAIYDGDEAAVQAHLDAGGSPDLKTPGGSPALVWAADRKNLGIVRMLIKAGANLELVSGSNETALTTGARVGALEVVEALPHPRRLPLRRSHGQLLEMTGNAHRSHPVQLRAWSPPRLLPPAPLVPTRPSGALRTFGSPLFTLVFYCVHDLSPNSCGTD